MTNSVQHSRTPSLRRMAGITIGAFIGAAILVGGALDQRIPGSTAFEDSTAQAADAGSTLTPLVPARVLETRAGPGFSTIDGLDLGEGRVEPDSITPLQLSGRGDVPADASAVALNITAIRPDRTGYITLFPCDLEQPTAANLNYSAGQIISNAALVPLDAIGNVCIYSFGATDLTVDINGFVPTSGQPQTLSPTRYLETRSTPTGTFDGLFVGTGRVAADSVTRVPVANRGNVVIGAAAATMNVTVVNPSARGYLTVYPCDQPQPTSANLNHAAGQTIANSVFSQLSPIGEVCIYSRSDTHLVVDVTGYVDGFSEPAAVVPARFLETRAGTPEGTRDGQREGEGRVPANEVYELPLAGRVDVPDDATAALLNVTAIAPSSTGYLTIFPCDAPQPDAANLVYTPGDVIANSAFAKLGAGGSICIYTFAETHLVVDVAGFVTGGDDPGDPGSTTTTGPTTTDDNPNTTVPGDTTTTSTTSPDTTSSTSSTSSTSTSSTTTTSSTIPVSPDTSVAPSTTSPPSSSPTSGNHAIRTVSDGTQTDEPRWDPCSGPIRYQVRLGQASSDQIMYLNDSIAAFEYATGFDMQFVGTTTELDFRAHQTDPNVDAVLMFATEAEAHEGRLNGSTIGFGGSAVQGDYTSSGTLTTWRQSGYIVLEEDYVRSPGSPWTNEDEWRSLILHELAHMAGLDHVNDETEVMNPTNHGVRPYQGGDLEGLWKVGTAQPCIPEASGGSSFAPRTPMYWDIQHDEDHDHTDH